MSQDAHNGLPAPKDIHSARDWLKLPSESVHFLDILHELNTLSITLSFPPRIIKAWSCQEENDENIVYVEVIIPLEYGALPNVNIMEEKFTVTGKYILSQFLVCRDDYVKLQVLQKDLLGEEFQELDNINQMLIRHIDYAHMVNITCLMPPGIQDATKQHYLKEDLIVGFGHVSVKKVLELAHERKNRDLHGA